MKTVANVSDESVKKATGKSWDEWRAVLDKEGARKMAHRDIARLLQETGLVRNMWWAQTVTVGYEYMRGSRVIGQTADAGFQVGVSRTIDSPRRRAWDFLLSPRGLKIWLGNAATLKPAKGTVYRTADGGSGEVRGVKRAERLRLTWKPRGWKRATVVQLYLHPSSGKTSVRFHQERLPGRAERERMRRRWVRALAGLEKALRSK
jgi:uncharacterized protein YndB with AHSA1/START domain